MAYPCAKYATYGTPKLAEYVVEAVGTQSQGCLMSNHGQVRSGVRGREERSHTAFVVSNAVKTTSLRSARRSREVRTSMLLSMPPGE